jgi:hypothetical protein
MRRRLEVSRVARSRDFEPAFPLLPERYFKHASGHAYALSSKAVALLVSIPSRCWRQFSRDDVSVGAWMLALAVRHMDDKRMCSESCTRGIVLKDRVLAQPFDSLLHLQHLQTLCEEGEDRINEAQIIDLVLQKEEMMTYANQGQNVR